MNKLVLIFNDSVTNFDLYDYRCDKYTQKVNVYISLKELKMFYKIYDKNTKCDVSLHFHTKSQSDFMLHDAGIYDILTYDDHAHVILSIDDISQYSTLCRSN